MVHFNVVPFQLFICASSSTMHTQTSRMLLQCFFYMSFVFYFLFSFVYFFCVRILLSFVFSFLFTFLLAHIHIVRVIQYMYSNTRTLENMNVNMTQWGGSIPEIKICCPCSNIKSSYIINLISYNHAVTYQ